MSLIQNILLEPDTRANQPAASTVSISAVYCVTDEAFILSPEIQGAVYVIAEGVAMAALHMIGNSVKIMPLEGAKAYLSEYDIFLKDHADGLAGYGSGHNAGRRPDGRRRQTSLVINGTTLG